MVGWTVAARPGRVGPVIVEARRVSMVAERRDGRVVIVPGRRAGSAGRWPCGWLPTGYRVGLIARRAELLEAAGRRDRRGRRHGRRRRRRRRRPRRAARGRRRDRGPARAGRRDGRQRRLRRARRGSTRSTSTTSRRRSGSTSWAWSTRSRPSCRRCSRAGAGSSWRSPAWPAYKGLPGESAYCASKAAVNAYMEGLRIALRRPGGRRHDGLPGLRRRRR